MDERQRINVVRSASGRSLTAGQAKYAEVYGVDVFDHAHDEAVWKYFERGLEPPVPTAALLAMLLRRKRSAGPGRSATTVAVEGNQRHYVHKARQHMAKLIADGMRPGDAKAAAAAIYAPKARVKIGTMERWLEDKQWWSRRKGGL